MMTSDVDFDLAALQAGLDAESQEKTKRITATNDWLVAWREATLREEMERLAADPAFAPVKESSEALLKGLAGWRDLQGKGLTTAQGYWEKEVAPHLAYLQKGDGAKALKDFYGKGNLGRGGWEQEFVARLNGDESRFKDFIARFDWQGLAEVSDPAPAPTPAPDEDTAVIRQKLNPPIDFCTGAPFAVAVGARTFSGLAINSGIVGGARNGMGGATAESVALIVMGGGAHSMSLIGADFDIPPDYETLSVTANLSVSYAVQSMAIFAGSTSSVNTTMRVQLSDMSLSQIDQRLTAVPSPFIAYREESRQGLAVDLTIANIQLNGRGGPARVFTGVEAYAAAAGIVGSSFARAGITFTLQRVCFSLR